MRSRLTLKMVAPLFGVIILKHDHLIRGRAKISNPKSLRAVSEAHRPAMRVPLCEPASKSACH